MPKQRRKPPKSAAKAKSGPNIPAGFILLCDIVDFSQLGQELQVDSVRHLWGFFSRAAHRKWRNRALFNCTGDGFVMACATGKAREFINLARELITHMHGAKPQKFGLRIGLHQGPFSQPVLPGAKSLQVIGTGINQCARLCPLGDDGDIAVSAAFVEGWHNEEKEVIWPELTHETEVFIKHGETMRLRFHRSKLTAGRPFPRRIRLYAAARRQMLAGLADIEDRLVKTLKLALGRSLSTSESDVRVSIFAEQRRDGVLQLRATDLRYKTNDTNPRLGETAYPTDNGGRGHVGRAFVHHEKGCQVVNNLPDPAASLSAYVRELSKKTGLESDIIRGFQRKARTFIAMPFGVSEEHADGVVCIDIMDPLADIPLSSLRDLAEELRREYALLIASLWRLRAHS